MTPQINNEYGTIKIEDEVIARVAGIAAMECYGIVGMAAKNVKDGIVQLLKRESLTKGIHLSTNNNSIYIDLHVIVEYGTNIVAIADTLISTIIYKVKEFIGLDVEKVNIFVVGVRV